jgi:hypothetical protein
MALCATCQDFDIQKFVASPDKSQGFELVLVAVAASEGCPFCSFIYNNRPAHMGWDQNRLWIYFRMTTASEIGYDALPPGPGARFTQLQVWIETKISKFKGRHTKEFRLISDLGM